MRACITFAVMVLATACGDEPDPTGSPSQPGLTIVAGPPLTDTVRGRPVQALVVEVRGPGG